VDLKKCSTCGNFFDFDAGGLGSDKGDYACSINCAKKLAASRGHGYAIHNHEDDIVETNDTGNCKGESTNVEDN
jgi:hypothetical protein